MKMSFRVIIIDDEPEACRNLQHILTDFIPVPVHVCAIAHSTAEADALIAHYRPDIIFLDIDMPNESGLLFLERIMPFDFEVIFVTAYDAYALKAIKLNALDYILKPINPEELHAALEKAEERIALKQQVKSLAAPSAPAAESVRKKKGNMLLRNGNDVEIVQTDQILFIEADWGYSKIMVLRDDTLKSITMSYSILEYEELLAGDFYRIHKSYLVNVRHIKKILKGVNNYVLLSHELKLPISRRKYVAFLAFLKEVAINLA